METATVPLRVEFANQPSAKRQPAKAKLKRRRSEKSDRLSLFLPPAAAPTAEEDPMSLLLGWDVPDDAWTRARQ